MDNAIVELRQKLTTVNGTGLWDVWNAFAEGRKLLAVAYADPPGATRTQGESGAITTMPHSWTSNTLERLKGMRLLRDCGVVLEATWDEVGGPVVLLEVDAPEVFSFEKDHGLKYVVSGFTSLCAHVTYVLGNTAVMRNGVPCAVAEQTTVEDLLPVSGNTGCNTAGEVFFPRCGSLTRLIRKTRGNAVKEENDGFEFAQWKGRAMLTTDKARKLFPGRNFAENLWAEEVAKVCHPGTVKGLNYHPTLVLHAEVNFVTKGTK